MLISIQTTAGLRFPLIAPVGAAAYTVRESSEGKRKKLSILFAMIRDGESGRATIARVMKEAPRFKWFAVDVAPANQFLRIADSPDCVAYDFTCDDEGVWSPDKPEASAFLEQVTRLVSSTSKAPASIAVRLEDWLGEPNKKK